MSVNFTFNNGGTNTDFDDAFIRKELFTQGGLWSWGRNATGQLGDNTVAAKSSPVQTVAGGTNWKQVSGGGIGHTAAIKTDGTLWTWGGNNIYGTLGDNTVANNSSPVQTVAAGTNWKSVASRSIYTTAIKTDGTLWTWGFNGQGQLGDNTVVNKSSPVQTVSAGTNWRLVAGGNYHTLAIKTDGTLWTWGRNTNGQLGDNTITHRSSPVQTIFGGTNWKQVAAMAEANFSAAIKTDGTLWTWGHNDRGQLGDGSSITHRSSPIQTISGGTNWKQVAGGQYHIAAIKTDGTLWTWGNNVNGQLGRNDVTPQSSPVQTVAGGTDWKLAAGGTYHTAAIKTDGTLWLWGRNNYGQLGRSDITHRSSPVQTVAGGTNWKQVAGSTNYTTAIREDFY